MNGRERPNGNSLERMLSILRLFSEDRLEWTSEEIMEKLGCSRPTVYRYLKTLAETGLLSSLPPGRFTLGPMVVELDYLLRMSDPLLIAGSAAVDDLAEEFSCTSMLLRWYRDKILCVYSVCSMVRPLSSYPRGRPMPLARGAIGRSIIASLPRRQSLPLIERYQADFRDVGFGDTVEEIYAALRRIRRQRVCTARGEVTPGVVGTAAPILDARSWPVGALCVTVAATETPEALIAAIANRVRDSSARISEKLRHDPAS